ncbi:hypothetical protein ACFQ3W_25610 [Paenibacillus puldeungensis]|uniref:HNH endonuclease n=1 Tax=Paenibacillus puldeungensis TaxID=696536 RepID=A0ABW3S5A5_9BACL
MDFGLNQYTKEQQLGRRKKVETPLRKRPEDKKLTKEQVRAEVKKRDGNWCLISGKPGPGLHLHRVVYGGMGGGGGKYEIWNCVLLSNEMHTLVHSNKRVWMPLLLNYLAAKKEAKDPSEILAKIRKKANVSGW